VAGYSIACSGFFMSRLFSGHLHLLESLFSLPLLLLLQEWYFTRKEAGKSLRPPMLALALAALVTVVNGHPQMPFYFLVAASLYALFRTTWRHWINIWGSMGLGACVGFFIWWPMLLLIQRSFRMLPLERSANDIALPLERIPSFFMPWLHGSPFDENREQTFAFHENMIVFWETVNFIGLLPLLALICLVILLVGRRLRMTRIGWFFTVVGILSLVTALPWVQGEGISSMTLFRSPTRQVFLTLFGLVLGLGYMVSLLPDLLKQQRLPLRQGLPWVLVGLQMIQLAVFARNFTVFRAPERLASPELAHFLEDLPPDARISMNIYFQFTENRVLDDLGFFDSLMLADAYRALIRAGGAYEEFHGQMMESARPLPAEELANFSVHYLIDTEPHSDLPVVLQNRNMAISQVPDPRPRVTFLAQDRELSAQTGDPVSYRRPESDRIVLDLDTPEAGVLIIRENFDPGWSARLDGQSVPIKQYEPRNFMLVAVPGGESTVELRYHTPGAITGAVLSLISLVALGGFILVFGRVSRG
jgi:hypothetical protein